MPRKQIQVLSKVLSMHVAATCRAYQYEPVLRVQAGSVRLRPRQDSERALSRKRAWRREKAGRGATTRARGAQLSASRLHRHSGVTGRHGLSRAVTRPPVTRSTGLRVMSSSLVHCTFTACLCRLHSLPQPVRGHPTLRSKKKKQGHLALHAPPLAPCLTPRNPSQCVRTHAYTHGHRQGGHGRAPRVQNSETCTCTDSETCTPRGSAPGKQHLPALLATLLALAPRRRRLRLLLASRCPRACRQRLLPGSVAQGGYAGKTRG